MPGSRSAENRSFDVVVVGGGPAGLAAAAAAVQGGCAVALVDTAREPGGQYWRHRRGHLDQVPQVGTFTRLAEVVRSGATYLPEHDVWTAEWDGDEFVVHAIHGSTERAVRGAALVVATGAVDRQLPFPGWDLPGVYTAGGAQSLLKGHGVAVGRRIVVGGTGPFLLPVAAGLAAGAATVVGVFEANRPIRWVQQLLSRSSVHNLRDTPARRDKLCTLDLGVQVAGRAVDGARYLATLTRHRVPVRSRHAIVAAHGSTQVRAVTVARLDDRWRIARGSERTVDCDAVAVGWGFTPQVELAVGLGAAIRLDLDGSLVVAVDPWQRTTVPRVFAAGELCGVGGAPLAVVEGEIAGRAAAAELGRPVSWPASLRRRHAALAAFAGAMHRVYPIRDGWRGWLEPDTLVCRCEEVPVSAVTDAVHSLGAADARSVKLLSRAGMGWCQGRICGYATSLLTALESGVPGTEADLARRPLAVPVPLGLLARSTDTREDA